MANNRALPGDSVDTMPQMLRVDHAGEYGATRIYAGQLAVLRHKPCAAEIQHMAEQEAVHLQAFNETLPQYQVRPTALMPFWHVAGYMLGAGSALLGARAAMACTVAVESVITEHYDTQLEQLPQKEEKLRAMIHKFREEEQEHHDLGLARGAEKAPAYLWLTSAIKAGCSLAIGLAKRI